MAPSQPERSRDTCRLACPPRPELAGVSTRAQCRMDIPVRRAANDGQECPSYHSRSVTKLVSGCLCHSSRDGGGMEGMAAKRPGWHCLRRNGLAAGHGEASGIGIHLTSPRPPKTPPSRPVNVRTTRQIDTNETRSRFLFDYRIQDRIQIVASGLLAAPGSHAARVRAGLPSNCQVDECLMPEASATPR